MINKKITWGDIENATQNEIKKTYKVDSRQLENSLRNHLYGASQNEMRKVYEKFYGKR